MQIIKEFTKEEAFINGLEKYKDNYHIIIYSSDTLRDHEFNENDPQDTMFYYYTLRCNVTHRGKSDLTDYELLKTAIEELFGLFKDVLKDTFPEE